MGIDYARWVARQTQAGHAQQAYPAALPAPLRRRPPGPVGPGVQQAQAAPVIPPQVQYAAPYQPPTQMPGQIQIDPEAEMINNLLQHIRDSLVGIPANLPKIKGLRIRLPDAYEGEDDFDKLDSWLQGLL